ncbi:MAG: hypothetical protein BGO49_24890 [Planctomycetales bacterium 71-10]|nr:MAG: hypothetical protein BGO49_24890 [Planctomycetales bacterium 71-10]
MELTVFQANYDEAYKRFSDLKAGVDASESPTADDYKSLDEAADAVEVAERSLDEARHRADRHAELEKRRANRSDRIGAPAILRSDKPEYSIFRALKGALAMREGKPFTGYEAEVHQDMLSRHSGQAQGGVFIPFSTVLQSRSINTTNAAGLVTTNQSSSLIDALRANLITRQLGVTVMSGLNGTVSIPRKQAGTVAWVAEGTNPTDQTLNVDALNLTPKALTATYNITRHMLNQTSYDVELLAETDLVKAATTELDRVVQVGSGTSNQPRGITNTSGVGQINNGANGGAPTWAQIYAMISPVDSANANSDKRGFAVTPQLLAKLATTPKAANTAAFIYDNQAFGVAGYPILSTSNLPANTGKGTGTNLSTGIYGNWSDAILGIWGDGIEVLVDPFSNGPANIKVSVYVLADVGVRQPAAFCFCSDFSTV